MPSELEKNPVDLEKKRGPYRTASAGQLPKRRSETSIENLAHKSAERGKKLEYMAQTLKRRDAQITELEKVLEVANQMTHRRSEEEDILLKQLEESDAQLERANARIESLMADLQFTQKEKEYFKVKAESSSTTGLSVKKKAR